MTLRCSAHPGTRDTALFVVHKGTYRHILTEVHPGLLEALINSTLTANNESRNSDLALDIDLQELSRAALQNPLPQESPTSTFSPERLPWGKYLPYRGFLSLFCSSEAPLPSQFLLAILGELFGWTQGGTRKSLIQAPEEEGSQRAARCGRWERGDHMGC